MRTKKKQAQNIKFPKFCDFTCQYSAFSDPNAVGACRKELAVWCKHFKRFNNKNNKCLGLDSIN